MVVLQDRIPKKEERRNLDSGVQWRDAAGRGGAIVDVQHEYAVSHGQQG